MVSQHEPLSQQHEMVSQHEPLSQQHEMVSQHCHNSMKWFRTPGNHQRTWVCVKRASLAAACVFVTPAG
jgi:hypothetical protein